MQYIFQSDSDPLEEMLAWLRQRMQQWGVEEEHLNSLEVACEEALVNILHHSYAKTPGPITLSCTRTASKALKIVILDQGPAHNPLHSIQLPSSSPRMGGYGIFMMLHLVSDVSYRRIHGCNELTLIKEGV